MKVMKKTLGVIIVLVFINSISALAWTINGVNYRSVYYGTDSNYGTVDNSSYIYADGGRTRIQVSKHCARTVYEKRTPPWQANIELSKVYGTGYGNVCTVNYKDEVRAVSYFNGLGQSSGGYMHV